MNKSKAIGYRFEKEVVDLATSMGHEAQRAWGSNGQSLGLAPDVDVVIGGLPFQLKKRKKIAQYLVPTKGVLGVITKQNRGPALAIVPLAWLLEVLNDRGNG